MLQSKGKLIGYRTYKDKNGADYHEYKVLLTGALDEKSGLFGKCDLIKCTTKEQPLKTLKSQVVEVSGELKSYNGTSYPKYDEISSVEGGK